MKRFFLIIICLILCGCTSQYDLEITQDSVTEDVKVYFPFDESDEEEVDGYAKQQIPISTNESEKTFYDATKNTNSDSYIVNYKYTRNLDTLADSYFLQNCFKNAQIGINDNAIAITTDNHFNCIEGDDGFFAEQVKVNITTKLNVLENNADSVNGNTYTWVFNEDNYTDKAINMTISNEKNIGYKASKEFSQTIANVPNKEIIFICLGLIIIIPLVYFFIKIKSNANNKI